MNYDAENQLTVDGENEVRMAEQEERMKSVLLRAGPVGYDSLPELTGFEDEATKKLVLARHFLRKGNCVSLRPILPLLLKLKGKPYKLNNYFPFEPFFRTRMARTTLLKTGRQVSKCMDENELVLLADGQRVPAKSLKVGDIVISFSDARKTFTPRKVTKVWQSGVKDVNCLVTESGFKVRVTPDHRLLARDADNHIEQFLMVRHIYRGDYLAVQGKCGELAWERVRANYEDGQANTVDIEVEEDHNFILGKVVSHNSTSLAAQGVVFSNSIPYFSTLYVTPLFEMIRRFSHNYVREFIDNSPVHRLFTGKKTTNQILQRSFINGSAMYFSYAFLDAERTRGIPADKNVIDEVQDMNHDFLQIIHETLSGSPWALKQYAGTPKSLDNTMESLWQDSSQAEWMIKCLRGGCGHWNIPSENWDLWGMIGKWHRDICEECPGVVCSMCRQPVNPRMGRWVHAYPERRWTFAGYHVPQIIMPMHYANQEKWDILVGKSEGHYNTTRTTFLNEVCGESCDAGSKLITESDLKAAAVLPWPCKAKEAAAKMPRYLYKILAVDWGGGGGRVSGAAKKKDGEAQRLRTSFTSLSVLGILPTGQIDCIWGMRSVRTHDFEWEARLCLEAMIHFKCTHFAHDYSNAGEGRLILMLQAGLPPSNVLNIRYHGVGHDFMEFHEPDDASPHAWYSLDKSRSLVTTCQCIKYGIIRFFQYDYVDQSKKGVMRDFLALIEEKVDSRLGTDVYTIVRNPNASDDFAQATNIGCCALWWMVGKFPDIAEAARMKIPKKLLKHVHPVQRINWDDF